MSNNEHPITPPPELVEQWYQDGPKHELDLCEYVATQAARWGADQELEACVKWVKEQRWEALAIHLRSARRPKPPSLKEQALEILDLGHEGWGLAHDDLQTLNPSALPLRPCWMLLRITVSSATAS